MGTFNVHVSIGHPAGGDLFPVSAMVDTGATHSMMPESLLARLRIAPVRTSQYSIADGSTVEYGVADARFGVGDEIRYCPVIFGPENEFLLGATTLEIFELVVDPMGERLVPADKLTRLEPFRRRGFRMADGTRAEYGVGEARFRIDGYEQTCPVIFGPEDRYLLGATTLENFDLVVDPTRPNPRLIPAADLDL